MELGRGELCSPAYDNVIVVIFPDKHCICVHKRKIQACISSATCCGISSARRAGYHQAAGKYTLARDEIQGRLAALDDIRRTSCVNDIPSLRLG